MTAITISEQMRTLRGELDAAFKKGDMDTFTKKLGEISALVQTIYNRTQQTPPEWTAIKACYGCYVN